MHWRLESIDEFVAFAGAGTRCDRVLDAGCGIGQFSEALARSLPTAEVLGVDITPASIAQAEKRREAFAQRERLRYTVADLRQLDLADDQFDLVFAHYLLVDCQSPNEVLASLLRVTKPGGVLCCIEPIFQTDFLNCQTPLLSEEDRGVLRRIYERMILEIPRQMGITREIAPSLPSRFLELGVDAIEIRVHGNYSWSRECDQQTLEAIRQQSQQLVQYGDVAREAYRQHPILQRLSPEELDSFLATQLKVSQLLASDSQAYQRAGSFTTGVSLMIRGRKQRRGERSD